MAEKRIVYEPHPVSPERKAELVKAGYRIVDAIYAPQGEAPATKQDEAGDELRIAKGPFGKLYIKRGKEVHSGPFASQEDAEAALAKETAA
jgi:hypothetical protein